jgi:hypothetical protein
VRPRKGGAPLSDAANVVAVSAYVWAISQRGNNRDGALRGKKPARAAALNNAVQSKVRCAHHTPMEGRSFDCRYRQRPGTSRIGRNLNNSAASAARKR